MSSHRGEWLRGMGGVSQSMWCRWEFWPCCPSPPDPTEPSRRLELIPNPHQSRHVIEGKTFGRARANKEFTASPSACSSKESPSKDSPVSWRNHSVWKSLSWTHSGVMPGINSIFPVLGSLMLLKQMPKQAIGPLEGPQNNEKYHCSSCSY